MNYNFDYPMSDMYVDFLRDESRTTGFAESISFPRCEDDVLTIVKKMAVEGTKITVQGARTGISAGAVPFGGHILNLSRMDKVLGTSKDESGKYIFRLEPGVVLSNFRALLSDKIYNVNSWDEGAKADWESFRSSPLQFFPPDPTETSAVIGGIAACNASGARTFRYGAVREYIRGLHVVLADGDVIALKRGEITARGRAIDIPTIGGRVIHCELPEYQMPAVKNAAGYFIKDNMDAIDLFIGSDGTLGVITEAEVEVRHQPEASLSCFCFFREETGVERFVAKIRTSLPSLVAIEYFDNNALSILREQKRMSEAFSKLPDINSDFKAAIGLEFHSSSEDIIMDELSELVNITEQYGGKEDDIWVATNEKSRDQLVFLRHAIPESVNMLIDERRKKHPAITKVGTDMSVPDESLERCMAMYRHDLSEAGLEYAIWGHIGNNHVHVNILPRDDADMALGKEIYKKWAARVSLWGGSVAAEHGIGKIKAPFLEIMYGQKFISQMKTLKLTFDPHNLLGVGNLFV